MVFNTPLEFKEEIGRSYFTKLALQEAGLPTSCSLWKAIYREVLEGMISNDPEWWEKIRDHIFGDD